MQTMMTNLEKVPCLVLEYELGLTDADQDEHFLYSKKFLYQKTELYRLGIKVPSRYFQNSPNPPATIFILTTNLPKTGVRVSDVVSFAHVAKSKWTETDMKEMDLSTNKVGNDSNNEMEDQHHQQLFTDPLNLVFQTDVEFPEFKVYGRVFLVGIVDDYRVHQVDRYLSQQLLSSVTDQQDLADFKLIASDGNSFTVHKWMLSARSPVFAALFSNEEKIKSLHLAVDCTLEEMSQFIRFIYTGELDGLVNPELMQLAVKYRIKTLEDICRTASQDVFSEDRMAMIALHLKSGSFSCIMEEQ